MTNDVTKMTFFAPDPKLMTVDFAQIDKAQADRRVMMDKLNPPKPEGPAKELQHLRRELFCLTERAKNTEIYTNNQAGNVKLLEQRIAATIKQKKAAASAGNDLAARNHEHAVTQLERELVDVQKEFRRAQRVSAQSAAELKAWPHHARVEELKKIVG